MHWEDVLYIIDTTHRLTCRQVKSTEELCAAAGAANFSCVCHTHCLCLPMQAGLLPIENANECVLQTLRSLANDTGPLPLLACVMGSEPLRIMDLFLQQLIDLNVVGIINYPSVGLADGIYRANISSLHFSYEREAQVIHMAMQKGMSVFPLAYDHAEAMMMASAGVPLVICHMGYQAVLYDQQDRELLLELYKGRIAAMCPLLRRSYPELKLLIATDGNIFSETLCDYVTQEGLADGVFLF